MFEYLKNRLSEPSTYAGLTVLGALVGLPPGTIELTTQLVAGGAALVASVAK